MRPTDKQLRTLCNKARATLHALTSQLEILNKDISTLQNHIIAQQGVVAALRVALGEDYDETTVPMALELEPE